MGSATSDTNAWLRLTVLRSARVASQTGEVGIHGGQPALVLAHLVLERPAPLTRDALVDLLWPERLPPHWQGAARKVVARTRAALSSAGLDGTRLVSAQGVTTLALDDVDVSVDVEDALQSVDDADAWFQAGDHGKALEAAVHAARVLRSGFFANDDTAWARDWAVRVDHHAQRARLVAARAALGAGRTDHALALADEAAAFDSYDERATRMLMAAHEAAGNRPAALQAYERCRKLLDDALGVRPSEETEAAFLALLGEAPAPAITPTPAVVARTARTDGDGVAPFVGRASEVAVITRALDDTGNGATTIVCSGEAGIGKTRLAAEAATLARAIGMTVVAARGARDATVPLAPFGDLAGTIVRANPSLVADLGVLAADLARIVPDIGVTPGASDDYAQARVIGAIVRVLDLAASRPLLIVLDDVQWLGHDAIEVLRAALFALAARPVVVLLTMRGGAPHLASLLEEVARAPRSTTLRLRGLERQDLVALLRGTEVMLGDDVDAVADALTRWTAGNPLYVTYLVRDALGSGAPFDARALPGELATLLEHRFVALDRAARDVLMLGAVCGTEFDVATLQACTAAAPNELVDVVDTLCRERLLEEREGDRLAFAHELVRDAVLAAIGTTRRARLHRRVGDALAAAGAPAAVVAFHLHAAGPDAAGAAAPWLLRAGNDALWSASWAEAAVAFERAEHSAPTPAARCQALIGCGRARRAMSEAREARASLEAARALARAHGLPREAAAATLHLVGGGGRGVAVDLHDAARAELLREALAGLTDTDADLLVPLLGELALALVLTDAKAERDELCERCITVARATRDPAKIAAALWTRRVQLMGPSGTVERLRDAREVLAFPDDVMPPESRIAAHLAVVEDALELGLRDEVDTHLTEAQRVADAIDHPYWRWAATSWRSLLAATEGRVDDAERLALEAFAYQSPVAHPEAVAALGVQTVLFRLMQGRPGEMIELLAGAAEANPQIPCYRSVLTLCCAEAGETDQARRLLDEFERDGFDLPPDSNWLLAVVGLADVAATLDARDAAASLFDLLAPFADRHVVLNCYGAGGAAWGPVELHLGRLSLTLGDRDDAHARLTRAERAAVSVGAAPFAARARAGLAALA